ncbi:MAG: malate/lactate/ureidoglycolate dehydrogenase [Acidimicrobiia bacterium]|nr:malate/lactate/ureidoglycolate dehydrogenase [Acidimicrobiia bacterium]
MTTDSTYHPQQLHTYVTEVCGALGSEPEEAGLVADQLIGANLAGHDSHGVGMMPAYVASVAGGRLFVNRHISVASDSGSVLVIDGNRAFGQVAGYEATNLAIERAREAGVALAGLRNSFHIGRIGHWGEQCARAGMVSIHFVNVAGNDPIVAPYGGADARFATNPICVAVPSMGDEPAALLDMATSLIALGKARVAHNSGLELPSDTALDGSGNVTRDPAGLMAVPRDGAIIAFGNHKGSGLAIMCELLGAALTGGMTISPRHERDDSAINSMLSIVIDPGALTSRSSLVAEANEFLDYVRSSSVRAGFEEVLIPGEPELRARQARAAAIAVDDGSVSQLRWAAGKAGLPETRIEELLG